jgi:hypothetical protein
LQTKKERAMAHKVRVDVKFSNLEQYQTMKGYLDAAGVKFDAFVTFAVDDVWNRMLKEFSEQEKRKGELANEVSGDEPAGDSE